ncbi:serine hydrolase domain-containing protein [Microbacterium sulfonylureivorans]|uniref:serine hydrolase domain-containing protein n=1 Tax=Microbacterium sulfonylureivorans TaxID=2486854 RepID=UPI000FD92D71|nr:serine hydrolase domain-containing protein [Microbacterium sulfonylureivorans]
MRAQPRKRRAVAALSAALMFALAVTGCSAERQVDLGASPQEDVALADGSIEQLQDAVSNAIRATGSSGAIVGVWVPWAGSWVAGMGTQGPGDDAEVTADMQFPAGRIARAMTCDVLYAAAAEGKVKLDDAVTTWVASVPALTDITLEQLCDGTSGIGAYGPHLTPLFLANPSRTWTPRELASFGLGEPRTTEPGAAYRDSDAGYVLLGLALERALGMSAAELIDEYVAGPLDLESTRLGAPASESVLQGLFARPAKGGKRDCVDPVIATDVSPSVGYTDSGVSSDIDDLGRYARALATGALQPENDDRFSDPLPATASAPSWYTTAGGAVLAGSLIGQFGTAPGYTSAAFSDPETGLTIAVVLNNSSGGAGFGAYLAWELAAIASKVPASEGKTAPEAGLPWTAEQYHTAISNAAVCAAPPE